MNLYRQTFCCKSLIIFLVIFCENSISGQNLTPKIIGGFNVSVIDGFKHQVSLRDESHERALFGSGHICGGSLIDSDIVCLNFSEIIQRFSKI
jgi:hypothetical protein